MAKYTKTKKARKGAAKNNPAPVKTAKAVAFNAHGKAMVAARSHAIASETSDKTAALTKQLALCWAAIHAGDMAVTTEHARRYLEDVRRGIIAKRRNDVGAANAEEPGEVIASRVGDFNAQLHLNAFVCRDNLIATLNTFDGLTTRAITNVARWMRGAHGKGGHWDASLVKAPSRDTIAKLIRKGKAKAKPTGKGKGKRRGPTGMPTSPDKAMKGLGHVVACLAAFDKAYGALLGSNRKSVATSLASLRSLFTPLRAGVAAKAKADAKAAAAKAKADK